MARRLTLTPYLTSAHSDVLEHQIQSSYPGMAHFANSGPFGATCGECAFLGYHVQHRNLAGDLVKAVHHGGCEKFHQLTGKHGPVVPKKAAACKYFEAKSDEQH
jgi:hypothetical protein